MAAVHNWEIKQMDVVTAFLNPLLEEEVYMKKPKGYQSGGGVCRLQKALYGLRQAPRAWYMDFQHALESLGFSRSKFDSSLFCSPSILLLIWVDDILILGPSVPDIQRFKHCLNQRYKMTNIGCAKLFIGIEIVRNRPAQQLHIHQSSYIKSILNQYGLMNSNGCKTPWEPKQKLHTRNDTKEAGNTYLYQSQVGKIMYLMLGTQPDLAFSISTPGRFNSNPSTTHQAAVKHLLRYLKQTALHGLLYQPTNVSSVPQGFVDADWAGDSDTRRSTTGFCYTFNGAAISWKSRLQTTVALSSTEAEYMALSDAAKESIWLGRLFQEIPCLSRRLNLSSIVSPIALPLFVDNVGCIHLAGDPRFHDRTKHIDIRHHFIREVIEAGHLALIHINF